MPRIDFSASTVIALTRTVYLKFPFQPWSSSPMCRWSLWWHFVIPERALKFSRQEDVHPVEMGKGKKRSIPLQCTWGATEAPGSRGILTRATAKLTSCSVSLPSFQAGEGSASLQPGQHFSLCVEVVWHLLTLLSWPLWRAKQLPVSLKPSMHTWPEGCND